MTEQEFVKASEMLGQETHISYLKENQKAFSFGFLMSKILELLYCNYTKSIIMRQQITIFIERKDKCYINKEDNEMTNFMNKFYHYYCFGSIGSTLDNLVTAVREKISLSRRQPKS